MPQPETKDLANLECPMCGIQQDDRNSGYEIIDAGFGMLKCLICGYAWKGEDNATA